VSASISVSAVEPGVWYQCQRCTKCCQWPGEVKLLAEDVSKIAGFFGLGEQEFIDRFTRLRARRDGLALNDTETGACIFLQGKDCAIQPVKPHQCQGFPNRWNFPGWREVCEAVPMPLKVEQAS
jgi:hypothetical protein